MILPVVMVVGLAVPSGVAAQPADQAPTTQAAAASHFARGQQLYQRGEYADAIKAFSRANSLAPHPSAEFNIARCFENVGQPGKALEYYTRALARERDAAKAADIRERIARLKALPVKVFVTSLPPGATITVGGRSEPERGQTPMVLQLRPGAYVLLATKEGHQLAAQRLVVEVGKPRPLEIVLQRAPVPQTKVRCPAPEPKLVDLDPLHIHVGVVGAIGLTLGRPLLAAPGLRIYSTFRHWVLGAHVLYFPVGEESITPIPVQERTFTNAKFRSILVQAEVGWALAVWAAQLELTAGVGTSTDRVIYASETQSAEMVREETAFAWSLGGALHGMVNRWLSVGASVRVGLIHGNRADKDDPNRTDDQHHIPYATFWGTIAAHL